jgi:hypothetical protein
MLLLLGFLLGTMYAAGLRFLVRRELWGRRRAGTAALVTRRLAGRRPGRSFNLRPMFTPALNLGDLRHARRSARTAQTKLRKPHGP